MCMPVPACVSAAPTPQGLPGLLVALRRPLRLEAAFLSHSDAAQLRQLLDRLAEVRQGQQERQGLQAHEGNQGQPVRSVAQQLTPHEEEGREDQAGASSRSAAAEGSVMGCSSGGAQRWQDVRAGVGEGATVVVWEEEACMSGAGATGLGAVGLGGGGGSGLAGLMAREMRNCHGGWAVGGGLWWGGGDGEED